MEITPKQVRQDIKTILRDTDKKEKKGLTLEEIKEILPYYYEEVTQEITELLKQGYIYEPKINTFRWLG